METCVFRKLSRNHYSGRSVPCSRHLLVGLVGDPHLVASLVLFSALALASSCLLPSDHSIAP